MMGKHPWVYNLAALAATARRAEVYYICVGTRSLLQSIWALIFTTYFLSTTVHMLVDPETMTDSENNIFSCALRAPAP